MFNQFIVKEKKTNIRCEYTPPIFEKLLYASYKSRKEQNARQDEKIRHSYLKKSWSRNMVFEKRNQ